MRASQQDGTYPRPLLVREEWTSLDGVWEFAHDDDDRGMAERWYQSGAFGSVITVPFAPESGASGIAEPDVHPVVWYRRTLELDDSTDRTIVHFGGVDNSATVWVDGRLVGTHVGGQTAFGIDVTDALDSTREHTLVVRAEDPADDPELPRGKQDWEREPHFIWYRRSTGIWKSVWLERVPPVRIESVTWTADVPSALVTAVVRLTGAPARGARVLISLALDGEPELDFSSSASSDRVVVAGQLPGLRNAMARDRIMWSPENPVLHDAIIELELDGAVVDRVGSYVGVRSAAVDRGAFLLNGLPYFVRSVLEQGFWPESDFTAPDLGAYRREVELIKALGFNAARVHQKVEDPRFHYWADRLGLLLWGEIGAAYEFTPRSTIALTTEWMAVIEQYRNHPSIVTWVPINESWGVQDLAVSEPQRDFVQAITSLTRALDPTRPVISNDGWEHVDTDIIALHDYSLDPARLAGMFADAESVERIIAGRGPQGRPPLLGARRPGAPVMVTEFGGISFSADAGWGYIMTNSPEQYRERLAAVFGALHASGVIAGFCYTQLTDTLQEANGLLTAQRQPKLPLDELRAIVLGEGTPQG